MGGEHAHIPDIALARQPYTFPQELLQYYYQIDANQKASE
jgi:hypothetical protein